MDKFGESKIKPKEYDLTKLMDDRVLEIISEEIQKASFESLMFGVDSEQAIKYHTTLALHRILCREDEDE